MSAGVLTVQRDARAFVAHELAAQIADGASLPAALQKLRDALPAEFHWAIGDAERMLSGGAAPPAWSQFDALLRASRDHDIAVDKVFAAFERSAHAGRAAFTAVLAGAMSLGWYMLILAGLLLVVAGVYVGFVLPQFQATFREFGADPPEFTAATIGNGWIALPLIGLLAAVVVGFLIAVLRLQKRLHALQPVTPMFRWIPILSGWARGHDAALWMRYYAIFLDAGATAESAGRAAAQVTGFPDNDHRTKLVESAVRLGRPREGLEFLLEVEAREAAERFERPRDLAFLLLRLVVYAVVACFVLAMYLPIFKLGAVI